MTTKRTQTSSTSDNQPKKSQKLPDQLLDWDGIVDKSQIKTLRKLVKQKQESGQKVSSNTSLQSKITNNPRFNDRTQEAVAKNTSYILPRESREEIKGYQLGALIKQYEDTFKQKLSQSTLMSGVLPTGQLLGEAIQVALSTGRPLTSGHDTLPEGAPSSRKVNKRIGKSDELQNKDGNVHIDVNSTEKPLQQFNKKSSINQETESNKPPSTTQKYLVKTSVIALCAFIGINGIIQGLDALNSTHQDIFGGLFMLGFGAAFLYTAWKVMGDEV